MGSAAQRSQGYVTDRELRPLPQAGARKMERCRASHQGCSLDGLIWCWEGRLRRCGGPLSKGWPLDCEGCCLSTPTPGPEWGSWGDKGAPQPSAKHGHPRRRSSPPLLPWLFRSYLFSRVFPPDQPVCGGLGGGWEAGRRFRRGSDPRVPLKYR